MNKQQIAQAKVSWGIHRLQPHFAPPQPKSPQHIMSYDFDTSKVEPYEKASLYYRIEHSLARHPQLRHLSILPKNSMMVMLAIPKAAASLKSH